MFAPACLGPGLEARQRVWSTLSPVKEYFTLPLQKCHATAKAEHTLQQTRKKWMVNCKCWRKAQELNGKKSSTKGLYVHPAQHPSEHLKPKQCLGCNTCTGDDRSCSALGLHHLHHCKAMQSDLKLSCFCSAAFYVHFNITLPHYEWLNKTQTYR